MSINISVTMAVTVLIALLGLYIGAKKGLADSIAVFVALAVAIIMLGIFLRIYSSAAFSRESLASARASYMVLAPRSTLPRTEIAFVPRSIYSAKSCTVMGSLSFTALNPPINMVPKITPDVPPMTLISIRPDSFRSVNVSENCCPCRRVRRAENPVFIPIP